MRTIDGGQEKRAVFPSVGRYYVLYALMGGSTVRGDD